MPSSSRVMPIGNRLPILVRLVLLALCGGVAATGAHAATSLVWLAPLAALALVSATTGLSPSQRLLLVTLEGTLVGIAIASTGSGESAYLPYLIAPAFGGGLRAGVLGGMLPLGSAATALLVVPVVLGDRLTKHATAATAQWLVLAVLVGLVASWVRSVLLERASDPRAAQLEAFRLLTELRELARWLPGTLDPAVTGEAILQRARDQHRYDVGAVLVGGASDRQLRVLVRYGQDRPDWDLSMTGEGRLAEVWLTQHGALLQHRLATTGRRPRSGSTAVIPLAAGTRTLGLLVLESSVANAFDDGSLETLPAAVDDLVLQLQTGLVFAEVRELATYEERRRVAREIHDGIAQELASVAYALDSVEVPGAPGLAAQLDPIRTEVRRLISELRMSLFDLRSDVAPDEGLGAAIGRHVHQVGTASGLTVHLSLNESPVRLAADTEAEVFRIVQEAVANARKHAHAENLWVSCTIEPPSGVVVVEDDGDGLRGSAAATSHGLAIMKERAARIRAELEVEPRRPRGTRVRLSLDRLAP